MTNGYERSDNYAGGMIFVMGLMAGAVLGAGLGMLFAPKTGSDLRKQIAEQAAALASQAQDGYRKVAANAGQLADKGKAAAGDWADRGKEMYGKAKG